MKGLTQKQRHILDFIEEFSDNNAMPPTIYEIGEHFGIKAPTVSTHLKSLTKKNFLIRSSKARGLKVSKGYSKFRRKPHPEIFMVPILRFLHEFEDMEKSEVFIAENYLSLDANIFPKGQLFALRMNDNSMSQAGIICNDIIVFCGKTAPPAPFSIVAAFAKGKDFIRIYQPSDDGKLVELVESGTNPRSATFPASELKICGVFTGLIRCGVNRTVNI